MKKALFTLIILGLALGFSSCKRSEIDDPPWDGPAGFYILVEGSVSPAVLLIDGNIHSSQIYVRATDNKGNPLANRTIFLEQTALEDPDTRVNWGYFPNNESTYQKATDANGVINVKFYWPTEYYRYQMFIHAVLVGSDRAYQDLNTPQDYISLAMYRAFD